MWQKLIALILSWFKPKPILVAPPLVVRPLQINAAGIALIKQFESCRLTSYQDGAGIWTLGWGHAQGITQGMTCTQAQADDWFEEDISFVSKVVSGLVPPGLNPNQFSACVSLAYNIGTGRFASSTLLKLLRLSSGNYSAASAEFLRWDKVDGNVSDGLLERRTSEQKLFNTPS